MQTSSFYKASLLVFGFGIAGCGVASTDAAPKDSMALAGEASTSSQAKPSRTVSAQPEAFPARMKAAEERGDWPALLEGGRQWQKASPQDPAAFFAEAQATYMMGDVDASIPAWEKLIAQFPATASSAAGWLKTARTVRANFPNLKLKPLQFEPGEASREQDQWQQKAAALLEAKRYDEIEKVAAQLQKFNASNVKGSPHLSFFFAGLAGSKTLEGTLEGTNDGAANMAEAQKRIAAWRAARPASNLARLVSIETWTDAAWNARGTGMGSTITPAMSAKMNAALRKGAQEFKALPKTAFNSPLAYVVALDVGLLSSAPREFLDEVFEAGTQKFPAYMPLYRTRALHLLPRWFGEPGEALAMIEKRANQIGGAGGDVFYGQVVWYLEQLVAGLSKDFSYDYARVARGLTVLSARHPDSMSVASARLALAYRAKDWKAAQQILSGPSGHILDSSWERWAVPRNQSNFAEQRMLILGQTP